MIKFPQINHHNSIHRQIHAILQLRATHIKDIRDELDFVLWSAIWWNCQYQLNQIDALRMERPFCVSLTLCPFSN